MPSTTTIVSRPASIRSPTASTMPNDAQSAMRPLYDGKHSKGLPPCPYSVSSMSWPRLPLNQRLFSTRMLVSPLVRGVHGLDALRGLDERRQVGAAHDIAVIAHRARQHAFHARLVDDERPELGQHLVVAHDVGPAIAPRR